MSITHINMDFPNDFTEVKDKAYTLKVLSIGEMPKIGERLYDSILCLDTVHRECLLFLRNNNVPAYSFLGPSDDGTVLVGRKITFKHNVISTFDLVLSDKIVIKNRFVGIVPADIINAMYMFFGRGLDIDDSTLKLGDTVYYRADEKPVRYIVQRIIEERSIIYGKRLTYDIESDKDEDDAYCHDGVLRENLFTPKEYRKLLVSRLSIAFDNLHTLVPQIDMEDLIRDISNAYDEDSDKNDTEDNE